MHTLPRRPDQTAAQHTANYKPQGHNMETNDMEEA